MLSQVCQLQVFFSLLSTIILKAKPNSPAMATLMPILLAVPPVCAFIFESGVLDEIHKMAQARVFVGCSATLLTVLERCLGVKQPAESMDKEGGDNDEENELQLMDDEGGEGDEENEEQAAAILASAASYPQPHLYGPNFAPNMRI